MRESNELTNHSAKLAARVIAMPSAVEESTASWEKSLAHRLTREMATPITPATARFHSPGGLTTLEPDHIILASFPIVAPPSCVVPGCHRYFVDEKDRANKADSDSGPYEGHIDKDLNQIIRLCPRRQHHPNKPQEEFVKSE